MSEPNTIGQYAERLVKAERERDRFRDALQQIKRHCGGLSINNGTSTLGDFCTLVLKRGGG